MLARFGTVQTCLREMYDLMVKFYVSKVMYCGDKFMGSAAGIALKDKLDKSRRRHGALPAVNEGTILWFAGAEGLRWSINEVADFFKILSEFSSTAPFEATVLMTLLPTISLI